MTVPSQVNAAEMREALQLNFNSSFFWKVARGNYRVLVYTIVFVALLTHEIARGAPPTGRGWPSWLGQSRCLSCCSSSAHTESSPKAQRQSPPLATP